MPVTTRIAEGWFWMGSDDYHSSEAPRHRVWVDSFEIARTTVTRRDYGQFLVATHHEPPRGWYEEKFSFPEQPVVGTSWFDAVVYCEWLSSLMGKTYRLPTEAEWEKASRGSEEGGLYYWGNDSPEMFDYFQGVWDGPRSVAEWRPNSCGLWNMGDNVHEWCQDWYSPEYYAVSLTRNPTGPLEGTRRVSRGGSWRHDRKASRITQRSSIPPSYRYTDYGFRVAGGV